MEQQVLDLILANFNYGSGRVTSTATVTGDCRYDLEITYFGELTIEIDISINPDGSVKMDGLQIDHEHVIPWLDRLAEWKKQEAQD